MRIDVLVFGTRRGCGRWWGRCALGGSQALLDLFHVAFLRLIRFWEMFHDIGCSESRKHGEIAVSNCCEQGVLGGKTECSVEVSNCMCS